LRKAKLSYYHISILAIWIFGILAIWQFGNLAISKSCVVTQIKSIFNCLRGGWSGAGAGVAKNNAGKTALSRNGAGKKFA
jgi:hypothetical protein